MEGLQFHFTNTAKKYGNSTRDTAKSRLHFGIHQIFPLDVAVSDAAVQPAARLDRHTGPAALGGGRPGLLGPALSVHARDAPSESQRSL